jgi:hypothetical protein
MNEALVARVLAQDGCDLTEERGLQPRERGAGEPAHGPVHERALRERKRRLDAERVDDIGVEPEGLGEDLARAEECR